MNISAILQPLFKQIRIQNQYFQRIVQILDSRLPTYRLNHNISQLRSDDKQVKSTTGDKLRSEAFLNSMPCHNEYDNCQPQIKLDWKTSENISQFQSIANCTISPLNSAVQQIKRTNSQTILMNNPKSKHTISSDNHIGFLKQITQKEQEDSPKQTETLIKMSSSHKKNNSDSLKKRITNSQKREIISETLTNNKDTCYSSSERIYRDYKDRFILIPLHPLLIQDTSKQSYNYQKWISLLYDRLCKQSFYGFFKDIMNEDQMKVFFSQNLLVNAIKLTNFISKENHKIKQSEIFNKFENISKKVLHYHLKKYPEKNKIIINEEITKMIEPNERYLDPKYDILANLKIEFKYEKAGCYNRQIKNMFNQLIEECKQSYRGFQNDMKSMFIMKRGWIFTEVELGEIPMHQRGQSQNKYSQKFGEDFPLMESMQYKNRDNSKLKNTSYHLKYLTGRKISSNIPKFELQSDKIEIKSSQILRVIIKWIEQLKQKLENLEKHIENRYHPFVPKIGSKPKIITKAVRKQICKQFKEFLEKSKNKNNQNIENIKYEFTNYINKNKTDFKQISQNECEVGLATYVLSEAVSKAAIHELNDIIHKILGFQEIYSLDNKKKKQIQLYSSKDNTDKCEFYDVNYITFNIFDLIRAKCQGSFEQIKEVYLNLKEKSDIFEIVRIKNRLQTNNRDFLINLKYKKCPIICELQLGLSIDDTDEKRQHYLIKFNHFLYELKRSMYGCLTEAAFLNSNYSKNYSYFEERINQLKIQKQHKIKSQLKVQLEDNKNIKGYKLLTENKVYICHSCYELKENPIATYINRQFRYAVCGECIINSLDTQERVEYLLGPQLSRYFEQTTIQQVLKIDRYIFCLMIENIDFKKILIMKIQDHIIEFPISNSNYIFFKICPVRIKYIFKLKCTIQKVPQGLLQKLGFSYQFDIKSNKSTQKSKDLIKHFENYKKIKEIKSLSSLNIEILDFQLWKLPQSFFIQNLKKFQQIRMINLSHNGLTTTICFKGFNFLEEVKINYNQISKIDFNVEKLTHLQINHNCLTQIEIKNFPVIVYLDVSYNHITKLVLHSQSLQHLDAAHNVIKAIKKIQKNELKMRSNLKYLNLSENSISEIDFNNYIEIEELHLTVTFKILDLWKLSKLKCLKLTQNHLKSINLVGQQNLQECQLTDNQCIQPLYIGPLTKIKNLSLVNNRFPSIQFLNNNNLETLFLRNNHFTQMLDISSLQYLENFVLRSNDMISLKFGTNEKLEVFQIFSNTFKEDIQFNPLTKLRLLTLWKNTFKASVKFGADCHVETIDLISNKVAHQVDISALKNLKQLILKRNTQLKLYLGENKNSLLKMITLQDDDNRTLELSPQSFQTLIINGITYRKY